MVARAAVPGAAVRRRRTLTRIVATFGGAVAVGIVALVALSWREIAPPGLLILTYHRVVDGAGRTQKYTMSTAAFTRQLDILHEKGFAFVGPDDLGVADRNPGGRAVLLTFDDGTADHYTTVFPLLEARGIKGLFFVLAGSIDKPGAVTRAGLLRMAAAGQGIGSHGISHRWLDLLAGQDLDDEVRLSKGILEKTLGRTVTAFAPPGGWFNEDTLRVARAAGYRHFSSCIVGVNPEGEQRFVYRRVTVSGTASSDDFARLLTRSGLLRERIMQRCKHLLQGIIGTARYTRLGSWLRTEFSY